MLGRGPFSLLTSRGNIGKIPPLPRSCACFLSPTHVSWAAGYPPQNNQHSSKLFVVVKFCVVVRSLRVQLHLEDIFSDLVVLRIIFEDSSSMKITKTNLRRQFYEYPTVGTVFSSKSCCRLSATVLSALLLVTRRHVAGSPPPPLRAM